MGVEEAFELEALVHHYLRRRRRRAGLALRCFTLYFFSSLITSFLNFAYCRAFLCLISMWILLFRLSRPVVNIRPPPLPLR